MPKVKDQKAYLREVATKAGLSEEQITQVLEHDGFAKAFQDAYKPLPDYSHDLDDVRTKAKAEKDAEYKDWYQKELEKYNGYVTAESKLKKYQELYGDIDPNVNPNPNPNPGGTVLSKEDVEKLLDAKMSESLSRRDAAVLDLLDVRESHMNTFKKSLDVKAFESAWKEHPEWGGSLKQAYTQYMAPEVEKLRDADVEARIKAAREEGVRDGYTRKSLPTDTSSKIYSPMFDKREDITKLNEGDQEKHSREEFFKGL